MSNRWWFVAAGVALVALLASFFLEPEEQVLTDHLEEIVAGLNRSPSRLGEVAAHHFADRVVIRVEPYLDAELAVGDLERAWTDFASSGSPPRLELAHLEVSLEPPRVRGLVEIASQPRDLHARSLPFLVDFAKTGTGYLVKRIVIEVQPPVPPEARP